MVETARTMAGCEGSNPQRFLRKVFLHRDNVVSTELGNII